MKKDARFYFANLGADIERCMSALGASNEERYDSALARARTTLAHLRYAGRPEAYEEGLLLVSALRLAKEDQSLERFAQEQGTISYAPIV